MGVSMMRVRSIRLAAIAVLLGLVLAACSSKSNSASPTTAANADKASAGATTTTVANGGPDTPARPSEGCGTSTAKTGESTGTIAIDGVERSYYLHVPPGHHGTKPLPLLFDFHGYMEGAAIQRALSKFESYGDAHGFVTVTPQGAGKVPKWIFNADATAIDTSTKNPDYVFTSRLLDKIEQDLCIDEARVYSTGLSNGGMMSSWLACVMSDRVAAVAPVAGLVAVSPCKPSRAVPMLAIHGTKDPFLPYDGGVGPNVSLLKTDNGKPLGAATSGSSQLDMIKTTIPQRAAAWAKRNGCSAAAPTEKQVTKSVTLMTWHCPTGAEVELYTVEGGGHAWPGSKFSQTIASIVGPTTMEVNADDLIWSFFERHALPASN
jgi:polyhydroxybutyrate depolymerase